MKTEITQVAIWVVIIGMAVANFALRFIPIALVSRLDLPAPVMRWLSFVPVSVMGALVAGQVLHPTATWTNPFIGPGLYAAALTALVFQATRSFLGATVVGMASFVALQHIIPIVVR